MVMLVLLLHALPTCVRSTGNAYGVMRTTMFRYIKKVCLLLISTHGLYLSVCRPFSFFRSLWLGPKRHA